MVGMLGSYLSENALLKLSVATKGKKEHHQNQSAKCRVLLRAASGDAARLPRLYRLPWLLQFNMNGLVGVNALVWVAVALAVLINEAAALGGGVGGGRSFERKK
ncbi:hypothetical protein MTO96_035746 [Rhipicephalus appendiculatus]